SNTPTFALTWPAGLPMSASSTLNAASACAGCSIRLAGRTNRPGLAMPERENPRSSPRTRPTSSEPGRCSPGGRGWQTGYFQTVSDRSGAPKTLQFGLQQADALLSVLDLVTSYLLSVLRSLGLLALLLLGVAEVLG